MKQYDDGEDCARVKAWICACLIALLSWGISDAKLISSIGLGIREWLHMSHASSLSCLFHHTREQYNPTEPRLHQTSGPSCKLQTLSFWPTRKTAVMTDYSVACLLCCRVAGISRTAQLSGVVDLVWLSLWWSKSECLHVQDSSCL